MDGAAVLVQLAAVHARLAEQEHQNNWYSFHIQRLEALWRDLQAQQSSLARQIQTIRRSILRVLAIVRQQRIFLHRISHRVGVLEERLEVAYAHTADQADIIADLQNAVRSLRAFKSWISSLLPLPVSCLSRCMLLRIMGGFRFLTPWLLVLGGPFLL